MLRSQAETDALQPAGMRTRRRSGSAHFGCVRHALRFLLRGYGLERDACRRLSLLLRSELLEMVQHDLAFLQHVTPAAPYTAADTQSVSVIRRNPDNPRWW